MVSRVTKRRINPDGGGTYFEDVIRTDEATQVDRVVGTSVPPQAIASGPKSAVITITVAATAQVLADANDGRLGWAIQNQSGYNLYVRGRGVAGTTDATQDSNSIIVPPGAYYAADYVTPHALSIIGPAAGQAFWFREW